MDAFERAYRELAAIVGCITFVDGTEIISLFGGDAHRPSIDLLIAPQSTVHHLDGKLAYDAYWFSEWMPKNAPPATVSAERVEKVQAEVARVVEAVKGSPWRHKCEAALSLYYNAFSEHQASNSLLAGWRLLEVVAGGQDVKSDVLINRASSFYSDVETARAIGCHLRERRNASTHGEHLSTGTTSTCIRQLRGIIRPILGHFLVNPKSFRNLNEFWDYCDARRDTERLASMKRILQAV